MLLKNAGIHSFIPKSIALDIQKYLSRPLTFFFFVFFHYRQKITHNSLTLRPLFQRKKLFVALSKQANFVLEKLFRGREKAREESFFFSFLFSQRKEPKGDVEGGSSFYP